MKKLFFGMDLDKMMLSACIGTAPHVFKTKPTQTYTHVAHQTHSISSRQDHGHSIPTTRIEQQPTCMQCKPTRLIFVATSANVIVPQADEEERRV